MIDKHKTLLTPCNKGLYTHLKSSGSNFLCARRGEWSRPLLLHGRSPTDEFL